LTSAPNLQEPLVVAGVPTGARPWRNQLAAAVRAAAWGRADAVRMDFTVRAGQWVDLDTLSETAIGGLRDAGALERGLRGLQAFVATKREGAAPGVRLSSVLPAAVTDEALPGQTLLDVRGEAVGGRDRRAAKVWWREAITRGWGGRAVLSGAVWAEVTFTASGSPLRFLEPLLDATEPVLGRDPRGRPWQEFFPNDDRIVWLRVGRVAAADDPVRLRLGALR
jgi:hypothetical protein